MNHEDLLRRYMQHVVSCEGIDFLSRIGCKWASTVEFTDEEIAYLEQISKENEKKEK